MDENKIEPNDESAAKNKILSSIFEQTKKLADTLKSYQNFLYQEEQTKEAAQIEKFVEEGDAKRVTDKPKDKKKVKKKDEGVLGKIIGFIAFGLFAFLPLLLAKAKDGINFIKSFASNVKETFTEVIKSIKETIVEYVVDPIKTFFAKTLPIAWNNIMFTIQDAIEDMIDAPKNAINSLLQLGNEIVAEAIDKVVGFIKEHEAIINAATFGKGKAIVEGLEAESQKRKKSKEDLQAERDKLEEERKKARQERESKDVAAYTKEQQAARGKPTTTTAVVPEKAPEKGAAGEAKPAEKVEPPKEGDVKPASNGKFSDPDAFAKAMFPYAKYVSESLGGKVPPIAFLGQWAGESNSGKSLPADFNYAGIKAFGSFKKGDFVLTEEQYTDAQLKRAQQSGESLYRVLDRDTKMDKPGKRKVTVDEWFGKGQFDAAERSGKHWVQVKSYFAKFDSLQDFADGYIKILKNPRYKKALESGSAGEFGLQVAKAGYATASAEKYSQHIASYEKQYGSKLGEESSGKMVASADSGAQIDKASMGAKIEAPPPASTSVINQPAQPTSQVAAADTGKRASAPNSQQAQGLYQVHLAAARA